MEKAPLLYLENSNTVPKYEFLPYCSKCGTVASTIQLFSDSGKWYLIYHGTDSESGRGNDITTDESNAIIAGFMEPYIGEMIGAAGFYDDGGFCLKCCKFYCPTHWNISTTGGGVCPEGHFKSLDPHWSPDSFEEKVEIVEASLKGDEVDSNYQPSKSAAERLKVSFRENEATADAEYQRLRCQLDPKDSQFGNNVNELFLTAGIDRMGGLGKKIALLTYLVENELVPVLSEAVKFYPEPVEMFSLVSIYMDDPQAIVLLTTVLEYEVIKYPDDQMVIAQAKAFLYPIDVMLEMDRNDPAEAEKSWNSGSESQPEALTERENAHCLFRLINLKVKQNLRVNSHSPDLGK